MTLSEILSVSATGFIVVLIVLILLAVIIVMLSKVIQAIEGTANKESAPIENTEKKPAKEVKKASAPVSAPVETPAVATAPVQYSNGVTLYERNER